MDYTFIIRVICRRQDKTKMKSKIKIYIIIILLFSLIVALVIKNINDEKNKNQSITEQNRHTEFKYEQKADISIDYIIDVDYYFERFITNGGDLYLYSQNGLFSNEKNYKKVNTETKFIRFIDSYILSNDGKLYGYEDDKLAECDVGTLKELSEKIGDKLFKISLDVYGYYDENSIYIMKYNYSNFNYEVPVLIGSIPNDEEILNVNSNINCVYIKTNKNYYLIKGVKKYQDQDLIYEITKEEESSNNYENISFCNEEFLIFRDDLKNFYTRERHNWDV